MIDHFASIRRGRGLALAAMLPVLLLAAVPAAASKSTDPTGTITTDVRVSGLDRTPETAAEVGRVQRRLANAALEACGASTFSLTDVKRAVAGSTCWRQAYAEAAGRVRWPDGRRDSVVAP
ncbi:UrcA family protein [uncultured Sphingomonas sp.]|uniref:UrcA family protein n=1 Tax=uncultured Sphingomonas sp. TaxID=158754 RepID=UPI0025F3E41C|nr:UrcA family protein [uncultured Sphingomonas sp.]